MTDIYIFEGGDLVGKTTMANRIADRLEADGVKVTRLHFSPPEPGKTGLELYLEPLIAAVEANPHGAVVLDRYYLGEDIYGPLLRGKSVLTPMERLEIEAYLDSVGAQRIWLDEPDHILKERFAKRGDDLLGLSQIIQAAHAYRAIMEQLPRWKAPEECDACGFYFLEFELDDQGLCDDCSVEAAMARSEQLLEDQAMEERAGVWDE